MKKLCADSRVMLLTGFVVLLFSLACVSPQPSGQAMAPELRAGCITHMGAVLRGPQAERKIALCFTAHSFGEGGEVILDTLRQHSGRGSFFLTGDFLENTEFQPLVRRMLAEGHYVGPHSDKHLLYCSWEPSRETLVTQEQFRQDVRRNIARIRAHQRKARQAGVPSPNLRPVRYFMPPYEHYNEEIARWTEELGLILVNFTPGTRSNADYTGEGDKNFVSSETIYNSILAKEETDANGLNGFLLLLHLGAGPGRQDKFHARFNELCAHLARKGYQFVTVEELLGSAGPLDRVK